MAVTPSSENAATSAAAAPSACVARIASISGSECANAADQRREPERAIPALPRGRPSRCVGASLRRQQRDREHGGVDADHRGDPLDRRVQGGQQLRQREHDDRAVGEREGRAGGDRQRAGTAHTGAR